MGCWEAYRRASAAATEMASQATPYVGFGGLHRVWVQGLGSGFGVQGLGFRVWGLKVWVWGLWFRVWGLKVV